MISLLYKHHLIVANGQFEEQTRLWRPIATVSWNTNSAVAWEILKEPVTLFESTEAAERFGVEMARAWVDEHGSTNVFRRP
jgi:hypothetical protein